MVSSLLKRIAIIGSGNWGSTIGKIIGNNVNELPDFCKEVKMWVFEEQIGQRKLTDIINSDHENVKYLPGIKLPENLSANADIADCVKDADFLIFVLPHQFLKNVFPEIKTCLKKSAIGISLIKGTCNDNGGLDVADDANAGIKLLTDVIRAELDIPCGVLMGANLADEVSKEMYCEATLAFNNLATANDLKRIFQTNYFRITCITDEAGAELCGALKNIVAVGAGVINGLELGNNTKAAVIRLGFMEMKAFIFEFFSDRSPSIDTFLESCGMADLITTCYGGRNTKVGYHLATTQKSVHELEKELLNGQSAQGPLTAAEVYHMLTKKGIKARYPLFTAIHLMCQRELKPTEFIDCLRDHPVHM